MKKRFGNVTDFNPYFGTDYGICSLIKPQLTFNPELGMYNLNICPVNLAFFG